jgi:hypothetical protein
MLAASGRVTGQGTRLTLTLARYASTSTKDKFRVLVIGGGAPVDRVLCMRANCSSGSGGLTVANQIYDRFKAAGKPLNPGDVAVLDAAEYHYYQVSAPN